MLPPTIALFLRSPETRAYVAAGFDSTWSIAIHECLPDLLASLISCDTSLVIMDAGDEQQQSNASAIAAVRTRHQQLPILVVFNLVWGSTNLVLDAVRAGATGLVFRGVDDSRHAVRTAIQEARRHSLAQIVHDEVLPLLPIAAVPLLRFAIRRAGDEPSVIQAAREIGVDRKTLFNWLRPARVAPSEFLNWVRLSLAVGTLERTNCTAERVALDLGFASGTAFRNLLQRYTGRTSGDLRSQGSLGVVLAMFKERLKTEPGGSVPAIIHATTEHARRRA